MESITAFGFGEALVRLRQGKKVARLGWNGRGMFLALQVPDEHSKMQQPYIYISPVSMAGGLVPWVASHPDLLTADWYEVTE